jgi:hypothetical protein
MTYTAEVTIFRDPYKTLTQSEYYVELLNVKPGGMYRNS